MMSTMRVAVTLEHLWHRVPGGTALATLETLNALLERRDTPDLVGVAGRHRQPPDFPWRPPQQVRVMQRGWLRGPLLYEAWLRTGRPRVETITGAVDVVHATTIIPPPTRAPLVVTLHDLAFVHEPQHFTPRGVSVFRRSLDIIRRRAALVLCSSQATFHDALAQGFESARLRLVPLGVRSQVVTPEDRQRVRHTYQLPSPYLLFVGTLEPRKNLAALVQALAQLSNPPPLVVAGANGWGGVHRELQQSPVQVQFLGFVPAGDLPALYAEAAALCMPSLREGYGLPVLEAMAQGTPVVTSRGTATEETAGGAAALIDPHHVGDIARGVSDVLAEPQRYRQAGLERAAACTWHTTAQATLAAYREVGS
jgi:glycosyltransferase involved in cell wall biosynthesis